MQQLAKMYQVSGDTHWSDDLAGLEMHLESGALGQLGSVCMLGEY